MSVRSLLKLNKGNKIHLGSSKAIFVKVSQNFIKSEILPNLTDFSSQLMACMYFSFSSLPYVVTPHLHRLTETVHMRGHMFLYRINKNYL